VALDQAAKKQIVAEYGASETDTGSSEVQVAILSKRVAELTEHLKVHPHDHHTRRGLLRLNGRRKRLLEYIAKNDIERYRALIAKLGIRDLIQRSGARRYDGPGAQLHPLNRRFSGPSRRLGAREGG
jgi:small subunit ribosomal protein S15